MSYTRAISNNAAASQPTIDPKGKDKDETGAIDPIIMDSHSDLDSHLFSIYNPAIASTNPLSALENLMEHVSSFNTRLGKSKTSLLPVAFFKDELDRISQTLVSAVFNLHEAEATRVRDVADALDRDQELAKAHKDELVAVVRDLEARHMEEIAKVKAASDLERDEFQTLLLDNKDRLTAENLRLKGIVETLKADHTSDFDAGSDQDDSGFAELFSPIPDPIAVVSSINLSSVNISSSSSASTTAANKENSITAATAVSLADSRRQTIQPVGLVIMGCSPSSASSSQWSGFAFSDHVGADFASNTYFDVEEAQNKRILSYIDSPSVSPTAGKTSLALAGHKRARDEAGLSGNSPVLRKKVEVL